LDWVVEPTVVRLSIDHECATLAPSHDTVDTDSDIDLAINHAKRMLTSPSATGQRACGAHESVIRKVGAARLTPADAVEFNESSRVTAV